MRDPSSGELRGLCLSFVSFQVDAARVAALRDALTQQVAELGRELNDPYWLD